MNRPQVNRLSGSFFMVFAFAALLSVYHYGFVLPQLEAARRIYIVDEDRLANAKVVDMQKRQNLGLITSEEGIKEEFEAFGQALLKDLHEQSMGYPVFRQGCVILSAGTVDLTGPTAASRGLSLDYSLSQYLDDYHNSLRERRSRPGE